LGPVSRSSLMIFSRLEKKRGLHENAANDYSLFASQPSLEQMAGILRQAETDTVKTAGTCGKEAIGEDFRIEK